MGEGGFKETTVGFEYGFVCVCDCISEYDERPCLFFWQQSTRRHFISISLLLFLLFFRFFCFFFGFVFIFIVYGASFVCFWFCLKFLFLFNFTFLFARFLRFHKFIHLLVCNIENSCLVIILFRFFFLLLPFLYVFQHPSLVAFLVFVVLFWAKLPLVPFFVWLV